MLGDLILAVKDVLKQFFCIHDYKDNVINTYPPAYYKECKKCGRIKWQ